MDSILNFFKDMVPQIGIGATIALLLLAGVVFVLIAIAISMISKKEKLMNKVIDEQSKHTQQTTETMKVAITEIKELSIMSMKELRGLSAHIAAFVDLATNLMANNQHSGGSKTPPTNGGDGA